MIKFYKEDHDFPQIVLEDVLAKTNIKVENRGTLESACNFYDPCCLNLASHIRPGGGYESVMDVRMPIKTQEEDLFRRSDLPKLMDTEEVRQFYPLDGLKGVYCSKILVTKTAKLEPCIPFEISLISLAAVVNPQSNQWSS